MVLVVALMYAGPTSTWLSPRGTSTDEDRKKLRKHFRKHRWEPFDEEWIRSRLSETAMSAYEDEVPLIVTKLLSKQKGAG